jgi:hypothetical protein
MSLMKHRDVQGEEVLHITHYHRLTVEADTGVISRCVSCFTAVAS